MPISTAVGVIQGASRLIGYTSSVSALAALLATRQFVMTDIFTISTAGGQVFTLTSYDQAVIWKGIVYTNLSLQVEGLRTKRAVGLSIDEQDITINATRDMQVGGIAWLDLIAAGFLDFGQIKRERIFGSAPGVWVGSVNLFSGFVSTVKSIASTQATLTVKSMLNLLNLPMPRNSWQLNCLHTLYDAGCALIKDSFKVVGSAAAGSTPSTVVWNGATASYFNLGTITWNAGTANAGLSRTIRSSDGGVLNLILPLPNVPGVGDGFLAYPGCDKTLTTCTNKFNNAANNLSMPFIPPATVAV